MPPLESFLASFSLPLFSASADALTHCFQSAHILALVVAPLGALTDNYSWIDKLWSIVPWVWGWYLLLSAPATSPASVQAGMAYAVILTIWGARLTANFARKGGYALSAEDYRWKHVQSRMPGWAFQVLNIVFIAFIQAHLLVLIAAPLDFLAREGSAGAAEGAGSGSSWARLAAVVVLSGFVALAALADEHQWHFHALKRAYLAGQVALSEVPTRLRGDVARGFLTHGLFRVSRHPNFFAEQMVWWTLWGGCCGVVAVFDARRRVEALQYAVGAVALSLLFQGSTHLTEQISAGKYPAYRMYQRTTSRIVPWFPGRELDELGKKQE